MCLPHIEPDFGKCVDALQREPSSSRAKLPQRMQGISSADVSSRSQDDNKRAQLALAWSGMAEELRDDSSVLQSIPEKHGAQLAFIFEDRSSATLAKYLGGWKKWLEFCRNAFIPPGHPSVASILDFCDALAHGAALDRGAKRACRAKESIKALKFVGHKLGLNQLLDGVHSPAVEAWVSQDKWTCKPLKEALPLPLFVIAKFERAIESCDPDDQWLIGCILLMVWGGLRWSDVQRLQFSSLLLDEGSLRGWCWRTKASSRGMCFGVLVAGVTGGDWGLKFGKLLLESKQKQPARDFLMATAGRPMSFTSMLGQLRRCLCTYANLSVEEAKRFTLHSCKATTLSWATQLNLALDLRAAQGHHALPNSCVKKYGRDDIWPQLLCQEKILKKVSHGWHPHVPINRGLSSLNLAEDLTILSSLQTNCEATESESDNELVDGDASVPDMESEADCESDEQTDVPQDAVEVEADKFDGPWLINMSTGWTHRAVLLKEPGGGLQDNGKCWGLACRPKAMLAEWYEVRTTYPSREGFQMCGHSGCFAK